MSIAVLFITILPIKNNNTETINSKFSTLNKNFLMSVCFAGTWLFFLKNPDQKINYKKKLEDELNQQDVNKGFAISKIIDHSS